MIPHSLVPEALGRDQQDLDANSDCEYSQANCNGPGHPFPKALLPVPLLFHDSAILALKRVRRTFQARPAMESGLADHVWEIGELLA